MIKTNLEKLLPEYQEFARQFDLNLESDIFVDGKIENKKITAYAVVNGQESFGEYYFTKSTELELNRYLKRYTKLVLYNALVKAFNKELSWGAINGIRPIKFARSCIDYKNYLKNEMRVSNKKVQLVDDIIKTQDKLNLDYSKVDVFVGIPFCPSRCSYCSFISQQITSKTRLNEYIDTLCAEIEAGKYFYQNNLGSIYIGGGTPIALPYELLEKLLKTIGKQNVEYTIEAGRPDCFDKDKLKLFADYGVSRICVNPQTLNDKTLVKMGRKHTAESVFTAYKMAREFPFIINTDLIAGLTDESVQDFKYSLDNILSLNPENITVHTLCLKAGSKLKTEQDKLVETGVEEMVDYANLTLKEAGFMPYYCYRQKYSAGNLENVGYSKNGAECRYNICVMEELTNNPAFGASANTKVLFNKEDRIERYFPPKDIDTYLNKIDKIIKEKDILFKKVQEQ